MLSVGSLFAGIGGFDLGLERAGGFRTAWFCEQDEFCQHILAEHWPSVPCYPDVTTLRGADVEPVDVLVGGFPCQDLSYAGKGAGLAGARSGLWSEYARLIGELGPRYVVVENVSALLARGLGVVLGDLAALGYDAEWDCLPASAFGAPHQRDRVWLVAYPNGDDGRPRRQGRPAPSGARQPVAVRPLPHPDSDGGRLEVGQELDGQSQQGTTDRDSRRRHTDGLRHEVADPNGTGLQGHRGPVQRAGERSSPASRAAPGARAELADSHGTLGDEPGSPGEAIPRPGEVERPRRRSSREWEPWSVEPDVGRVAHGVPARVDRLKALGNAIVPPIAEWIGQRILEHEQGAERAAA